MSYDNPWLHNGQIVEPDQVDTYVGFVYNIINLSNNKQYIGKKLFTKSKTKQVKGKKKKLRVASDWQDYYGSNKELQEDVANLGIHNFRREILRLCKTKGECSYYEAKYQFENDVLLNEAYYNSWIMVKVSSKHLKTCV
jgi:hypothetical protein